MGILHFLGYMQSLEQGARSARQEQISKAQEKRAVVLDKERQQSLETYHAVSSFVENPITSDVLGAGRMATARDVAKANLYGTSGLYLGTHDGRVISYWGDRHGLTYGRTRSGKGKDIILPVLAMNFTDSFIVTDIKDAENAYAVSYARKKHGQRVIPLNPFNFNGVGSFRLNPCQKIIDVAQAGYEIDGEDEAFIDLFLPMTEKQKSADNAWALEGAREILRLRTRYLAYFRPSECNPAGLWHMVHGDEEKIRAQYQEMIDCGDDTIADPAADYLHAYDQLERQYGGYKTGLKRAVAPYAPNSVFALETMCSDFDPAELKREPTTVFLMLPTNKVNVGAQWLTLIASTMMERIAEATGNVRTTVILDELANLPYMPIIPKALKLYGGLGVRMWGFCQGRKSLIAAGYTKETIEEFEDQAGFLQMWEVEEPSLLKDLELWSGKKTVSVTSATKSGGGGLQGSFAVNEVARPVMQTEDIRKIGAGKQLLKLADCPYLIEAERRPWFDSPILCSLIRDVRKISDGTANWRPEPRKRMRLLPAPPPLPEEEFKPDDSEMIAMLLAENDALRDQLAELKEQAGYEMDIVDVLKKALAAVAQQEKPA